MISLTAQIQALLDSIGISLDKESFQNLLVFLRVNQLGWTQRMGLAIALGILVTSLRKRAETRLQFAAMQAEMQAEVA